MIPFEIPDRFIGLIAAGAARRIGATIHDTTTGRIMAHVQETGWLPKAIGASPAGLLLSGGQLASSIVGNIQLEQVKRMLAGLKMLTTASLAVSAIGVGVSMAGFALVVQRLRHLERQIEGVHRDVLVNRLIAERIEVRQATRDWSQVESLLHQAEEAWHHSDPRSKWHWIESPLDQEQRYWMGLVGGRFAPSIFLDQQFTLEQAIAAYQAALTLATTRTQTLLLLDEMAAARHHATDFHRWHDQTILALDPVEIARVHAPRLAQTLGLPEADARARLRDQALGFKEGACEMQLHLKDRPDLIASLAQQQISGYEYARQLRERQDTPLVVLAYPGGP